MKLIFCKKCGDLYKLSFDNCICKCGATWGHYKEDGLHAVYGGQSAVPLGFTNASFINAILFQPDAGPGERFEAFVISRVCTTMTFEDKVE